MARQGLLETNNRRLKLIRLYEKKRAALKASVMDKKLDVSERFAASQALASLPRNSASVRYRKRCALTGRPRGFFNAFGVCRIALRELATQGMIPGVKRASW